MGKIEAFEGFKDSKELTVVRGEGDAELGLVGGVLGGHKLNVGVGMDLRQRLTGNIRAVSKVGLSRPKFAWGSEMPLQFTLLGSQHRCYTNRPSTRC